MFIEWIANKNPPWTAYCEFMPDHLIEIFKQPDVPLLHVYEEISIVYMILRESVFQVDPGGM